MEIKRGVGEGKWVCREKKSGKNGWNYRAYAEEDQTSCSGSSGA